MINITAEQFEQLLPFVGAATEDVFRNMEPSFSIPYSELVEQVIGNEYVEEATQEGTELMTAIRSYVIRATFLSRLHSHDLIMTDNGFGVVSNENIAPASQARVEAMKAELTYQRDYNKHQVIFLMRKFDGWSETEQAEMNINSLVWSPSILSGWCGVSGQLTYDDLAKYKKSIDVTEAFLRKQLGDALIDEIISEERKGNFAPSHRAAKVKMLAFIGEHLTVDSVEKTTVDYLHRSTLLFENLLRFIEEHIGDFEKYKDSPAYKANHMQAYENKADDPTFFFAG